MSEAPNFPLRDAVCNAIACRVVRSRRSLALLLALSVGFALRLLVNTAFQLAGQRLPGPIVPIHSP